MAYTITDTCTKDELCVEACPTDCIHPKKDEEQFEAATQLYVDPNGCIDCGACVPVCPTNSIFPNEKFRPTKLSSSTRTPRTTHKFFVPRAMMLPPGVELRLSTRRVLPPSLLD